ncbi:hypothetical protein GCM10022384_18290 [Streptomyces marokkonensis]|uniref:Uncharacterized protein n=1 Tax=Streptomyces marokkonensis TaxID=324855 RepID=A0ABP7PKR3_9ACTN
MDLTAVGPNFEALVFMSAWREGRDTDAEFERAVDEVAEAAEAAEARRPASTPVMKNVVGGRPPPA